MHLIGILAILSPRFSINNDSITHPNVVVRTRIDSDSTRKLALYVLLSRIEHPDSIQTHGIVLLRVLTIRMYFL